MQSAEAIHSIIEKTRQVSQSIEKERDAIRKLSTSRTKIEIINKCKEVCNQELEEEVLRASQLHIRQKMALNALRTEEDALMKVIKEKAQEFDKLQLIDRREMLFTAAEDHQLKSFQKRTRAYFESAEEFNELEELESRRTVMENENWGDTLADLQETESEVMKENEDLRKRILEASAISHEYRMKITTAKAALGRLLSSNHLERRQLESQLSETMSFRKNLEQRIPAADAEVRERRFSIARLERELQQSRVAKRF